MGAGGGGVPGWSCRRISAGDFLAIDVSDKAVVILHLQREGGKHGGIRHGKRDADVGRGVVAEHQRLHIRLDKSPIAKRGAAGNGN